MRPLEGIRVIEACSNLAGPVTGTIFGDMGAEVVKIEKTSGDDARHFAPPRIGDLGATFQAVNRNKKSVVLDFKAPEDIAKLHELIRGADVFIHNMRPGVAESIGLSSEAALALNPRLIYGAISGYGMAGPWRDRPGYDGMAQALSGVVAGNGDPNGRPSVAVGGVVDKGAGMWLALAVLSALFRRERTGQGGVVRTSLLEASLFYRDLAIAQYQASGKVPPRLGNRAPTIVPADSYETSDGAILLMCGSDAQFRRLASALDRTTWITDPRFATNSARIANREALEEELADIIRGRSTTCWIDLLGTIDVPSAPILDVDAAILHPQIQALGILQPIPGHDIQLLGAPWTLDGERPPIDRFAPALGADNADMLGPLED